MSILTLRNIKRLIILCILGGFFVFVLSFTQTNDTTNTPEEVISDVTPPPLVVPDSIFKKTVFPYGEGIFSGTLTVFAVPARDVVGEIIYDTTARSLAEWGADLDSGIIINGGFFETDYTPSGYVIMNGKRVGTNRFSEEGTGLFVIKDNRVSVRDLGTEPFESGETFDHAIQSFPLLISRGAPVLTVNRGQKARRTAIGVDNEQNIYFITTNSPSLTLYEFMEELVKTGIPFDAVLNLDGGPSTGYFMKEGEYVDSVASATALPNVILFRKK